MFIEGIDMECCPERVGNGITTKIQNLPALVALKG